jgi:flagellar hook assembly protein FlgD
LLLAPSPNPFSARTEIPFVAPRSGVVRIAVYDPEGRRVATLVDGEVSPGPHVAAWDGRADGGAPAPAGVYLVRMRGFGRDDARRVALAR